MWEIFSRGKLPYKGIKNFSSWVKKENHRLPMIDGLPLSIYYLMLRCWHIKKSMRPNMAQGQGLLGY